MSEKEQRPIVTGPKADMADADISDPVPADMDPQSAQEKLDGLSLDDRAKMPQSELLSLYAAAEGEKSKQASADEANPQSDDFTPGRGPKVQAAAEQWADEAEPDAPIDDNAVRTKVQNILARRGAGDPQTVETWTQFAKAAGFGATETSQLLTTMQMDTPASDDAEAEQVAFNSDPVLSALSDDEVEAARQAAMKMINEDETLREFADKNRKLFRSPSFVARLVRKAMAKEGKQ